MTAPLSAPLLIAGAERAATATFPVYDPAHAGAVVGYAAAGVLGGLFAAVIAFTPSFVFVLAGAARFDAIRRNTRVQAFMTGAGPAAIGAIAGAAIPLALSLDHVWQFILLAAAVAWLLGLRRGVVSTIVGAGVIGSIAALLGAAVG